MGKLCSIVHAHHNHPPLTNIKGCSLCPPLLLFFSSLPLYLFTSFFPLLPFPSLQLPFYRCHLRQSYFVFNPFSFAPSFSLTFSISSLLYNSFHFPPLFSLHSSLFSCPFSLSLLSHSLFSRFSTSTHVLIHCLFTTLSSHFLQHLLRPALLPSTRHCSAPTLDSTTCSLSVRRAIFWAKLSSLSSSSSNSPTSLLLSLLTSLYTTLPPIPIQHLNIIHPTPTI